MSKYLETIYFIDEYSPDKYPQKFCDHLVKKYFICNGNSKAELLDIGSGKGFLALLTGTTLYYIVGRKI